MDIAHLGLSVDSSQVDKGNLSLVRFASAASRAQAAQVALTAATKSASGAAAASARASYQEAVAKTAAARASESATKAEIQSAMTAQRKAKAALEAARADHAKATAAHSAASAAVKTAAAAQKAADAQDREAAAALKAAGAQHTHAAAMNDNIARTNRMSGSMSGLAAQFQDIGVTAAMDMNPLIIGLQQGTQIAGQMEAAIQGGSSAVSVLGNAFKSLFQPLTFISIALTALAAAGLQFVDWVSVGKTLLTGLADVLQTIAPYAVMAAAGLALLYAPAIISGLATVTVGIYGVVKALGAAAIAFAVANPAAAFVLGLTAVVASANIFRDELSQIFGVDIVGAAKTGANYVIGSFVAAYEDLKFVWNNFPAIMGSAAIGAANAVIRGMNAMISKATELLNGFISRVNGMLSGLPFGMGEGVAIPTIGDLSIGEISNGFADQLSSAVGARNAAVQSALGRDYLGDFGGAIARGASAASAKLRELAGSLGEADKAKKKAKSEAEKLAEKYNDILLDAEAFIATQMAEKDALLLTEEAANALRYEQEMLNKAMQAGITIDAAKAAEIKSYAAAMAGAEAETSRFRKALDFAKDLTKGFVSDLRSGLEQGKGFWKSFGDAALNVLDKIVDKLLNDVIDALFQVNSASSGAGGGGFLGSLLGGIGKLFGFARGGYTGPGAASQPAGIVHAGEYVFSKKAVDRIGVGHLDRAHKAAKGYMSGGYVRAYAPANSNLRGYDVGGYVTPTPQYHGNAAVAQGREVIEVVLRDDSGRMAEIADQQIQTRSGAIVQISVQQSVKSVRGQMSGMIAEAQTRKL